MIYVFGDSFSEDYTKNPELSTMMGYLRHKGYKIKFYIDLLSEELNQPITNYALGGMCNEYILTKFMEHYRKIQPGDIVIFGWTDLTRFMYPFNNRWVTNLYTTSVLSENTINEMRVVRMHKFYEKKQLDIIDFIDDLLPNNPTVHWTWSTIPPEHSLTITKETNGEIIDSHYGEVGHMDLYKKISDQLKITNRVRLNLWKYDGPSIDRYGRGVI